MDLTLQAEEVAVGGSFLVGEVGIIIILLLFKCPFHSLLLFFFKIGTSKFIILLVH